MGKRPHLSKPSALDRLPGYESAQKFYFLLQSWRDGAQIVLTALSSLCFTVTGIIGLNDLEALVTSWAWVWPILGLSFAALLILGRFFFFRPTYADLIVDRNEHISEIGTLREAKVSEADVWRDTLETAERHHRSDLQMVLDSLVTQLLEHICKSATDCRISAYSVEGSEFLLLSRCSKNPLLEVRGRPSYPLAEGNIGQAWAKEWAIQDHESTERAEWEESLVDGGLFAPQIASTLTMQSQSICAQRIDRGSDKIGMIVLECENPGRFTQATIKRIQSSLILKSIADILWSSHTHFPRVAERQAELTSAVPARLIPEPDWKRAKPIPPETGDVSPPTRTVRET